MRYRLNYSSFALATLSALSLVACGSDVGPSLFGNDGGDDSVDYCATHPCNVQTTSSSGQGGADGAGGSGNGGASTSSTSSSTSSNTSSGSSTTSSSSGTCVPSVVAPTRPALGIYYIQDRSGSMSSGTPTSWEISTQGLLDFLGQPPVVPTQLALQYSSVEATGFVCPSTCTDDTQCGGGICFGGACIGCTGSGSCAASDYAIPDVDYGALPGVATAVDASIASHQADSSSIAAPVIAGAIQAAQARAAAHADQVSVVFFVADGAPNVCDQNVETSYASARSGEADPAHIRTYVFAFASAMESDGITFVNGLASAGGTTSAYFSNTASSFAVSLGQASADAVACSLMTPTGSFGLVLDAGDGSPLTNLSQVAQRSSCGSSSSWYYADAGKKRIELCPTACDLASTSPLKVTTTCP